MPGEADQQHALGYARAHVRVRLGVLEEVHDLLQLRLLLLAAGHVLERDLLLLLAAEAGASLAKLADTRRSTAAAGLVHHIVPEREERDYYQQVRDHAQPPGRHIARLEIVVRNDSCVLLLLYQVTELVPEHAHVVQVIRDGGVCFSRSLARYYEVAALDDEALHFLVLEHLNHVGVGELLLLLTGREHRINNCQENDHYQHVKPDVTGSVSLRFQKKFTSLCLAESPLSRQNTPRLGAAACPRQRPGSIFHQPDG